MTLRELFGQPFLSVMASDALVQTAVLMKVAEIWKYCISYELNGCICLRSLRLFPRFSKNVRALHIY